MSYDFVANDIFEMAEQIEENGALFYKQAANSVNNKNTKTFLLELASMENEHKQIFKEMKTELSESEITDNIFDPNNESMSYLKALAGIRVFFKKEIDVSSLESILKDAIIAEKDSIIFYLGIKKLIPKTKGREKINKIISEEMLHIKSLSVKLKDILD